MKSVNRCVKLGDLAEITTGKSNAVDTSDDGDYPFYDRSQVVKRSHRYLFDVAAAVIVPGEGKEFLPRIARGKFDLHQRAYAIIPRREINAEYLYYSVLNAHDYFAKVATGSTVPSLRLGMFQDMPIHLPDEDNQLRIAGLHGTNLSFAS